MPATGSTAPPRLAKRPIPTGLIALTIWTATACCFSAPVTQLKVMSFNIWVNGSHGLDKVIEAINASEADVVGLQECNASTAQTIADTLGFHHLGVNDVSILISVKLRKQVNRLFHALQAESLRYGRPGGLRHRAVARLAPHSWPSPRSAGF